MGCWLNFFIFFSDIRSRWYLLRSLCQFERKKKELWLAHNWFYAKVTQQMFFSDTEYFLLYFDAERIFDFNFRYIGSLCFCVELIQIKTIDNCFSTFEMTTIEFWPWCTFYSNSILAIKKIITHLRFTNYGKYKHVNAIVFALTCAFYSDKKHSIWID